MLFEIGSSVATSDAEDSVTYSCGYSIGFTPNSLLLTVYECSTQLHHYLAAKIVQVERRTKYVCIFLLHVLRSYVSHGLTIGLIEKINSNHCTVKNKYYLWRKFLSCMPFWGQCGAKKERKI